jgi:hypothetical protein
MPAAPEPVAHELDPQGLEAGDSSTHEKRYILLYCGDDESVAYNTLSDAAPAQYDHPAGDTCALKSLKLDAYQGNGVWYGTASYSSESAEQADGEAGTGDTPENAPQPPADTEDVGGGVSFTTIGGTQHILQSRRTVASVAAAGGAVPDTKKAIGVKPGNPPTVDGVDIFIPKLEFTIPKKFAQVTLKYLRVLRDLTGTVNNAKFMRFEAGEVLFMGCTGDFNGKEWDIKFTFAVNPNELAPEIGNGMTVAEKKGWHYLWCSYNDNTDADTLIAQPIYAFVEQVYREENFARLGLFANG